MGDTWAKSSSYKLSMNQFGRLGKKSAQNCERIKFSNFDELGSSISFEEGAAYLDVEAAMLKTIDKNYCEYEKRMILETLKKRISKRKLG